MGWEAVLALLVRILLGGAFLLAGYLKARYPSGFMTALGQFGLRPGQIRVTLLALPAFEVLLGVLILLGVALPVVSIASILLMLVFTAAALRLSVRGESCNCFGSAAAGEGRTQVLIRNVALALAAIATLATVGSGWSLAESWGNIAALSTAFALAATVLAVGCLRVDLARNNEVTNPARRQFLKRMSGALATVVAAKLALTGVAEAACFGCGSCGTQYYFIGCTGGCCAAYWEYRYEYCEPSCYPCSNQVRVFCGISMCC